MYIYSKYLIGRQVLYVAYTFFSYSTCHFSYLILMLSSRVNMIMLMVILTTMTVLCCLFSVDLDVACSESTD